MKIQKQGEQAESINPNRQLDPLEEEVRSSEIATAKTKQLLPYFKQYLCRYLFIFMSFVTILIMCKAISIYYFQAKRLNSHQTNIKQLQNQTNVHQQTKLQHKQQVKNIQSATFHTKTAQQIKAQYKVYSQLQNGIDYQNYTGITNRKLSNTLLWQQLKLYDINASNEIADIERIYYDQEYNVYRYPQLPICVVITSQSSNAQDGRHIHNINSILMQQYKNYHIVFIDNNSDNQTINDIIKIVFHQSKIPFSKYLLIKNNQKLSKMQNLRRAAKQYCQPQEIFIAVDGDDQLIGRQVFKLFNSIFQQEQAWFVYSNFITLQNYIGLSRLVPREVIIKNKYRQYPFVTAHLNAFYTQLFRNIREEDLKDSKGQYLQAAVDMAICLPILEQAQQRIYYVPELNYYFNPHKVNLTKQQQSEMYIRSLPSYQRIDKLHL